MNNTQQGNPGVITDARQLGVPKMLILGLQHLFAMFGATVLVPILVNSYFHGEGLSIQVTLFFAGLGTLFFHLCSKMKVPAFLGSSFAFLGGFSTVANLNSGRFADMTYGEKLPYACGGIVVAGLLYLVLALVIRFVGVKKVMRFLPPVVTGPIIICIGLSLAESAIANAQHNWFLACIALAVVIIFNIWGKGMFRIIPILMGVVLSYAAALLMHAAGMSNPDGSAIIDFTQAAAAPWFGLPDRDRYHDGACRRYVCDLRDRRPEFPSEARSSPYSDRRRSRDLSLRLLRRTCEYDLRREHGRPGALPRV